MQAAAAAASGGTSDRVLIVAPPGVGKTRLIEALAGELMADGWHVLRARATPGGAAFEGIARLVRAAFAGGDAGSADASTIDHRISSTLPPGRAEIVVRDVRSLLEPAVEAASRDRPGRFSSWAEAIAASSDGRPQAWLLEDLHWAGGDLLAFLDAAAALPGEPAADRRHGPPAPARRAPSRRGFRRRHARTEPADGACSTFRPCRPSPARPCSTPWSATRSHRSWPPGSSRAPTGTACSSRSCCGAGRRSGSWSMRAGPGGSPSRRQRCLSRGRSRRSTPHSSTTCPLSRGRWSAAGRSPGAGSPRQRWPRSGCRQAATRSRPCVAGPC